MSDVGKVSAAVEAYRELMVARKILAEYQDMVDDATNVVSYADAKFWASMCDFSDEERAEFVSRVQLPWSASRSES
jgi:hypothetical protein